MTGNGSFALTIPSHIAYMLGLQKGDEIEITTVGKKIILAPVSGARQDSIETGVQTTSDQKGMGQYD